MSPISVNSKKMNCSFCKLLQDEKRKVIEEKKHVFVVLSDPRLMPGHLLIIPKRHVEKLSELDVNQRKELIETTIDYQDKILDRISPGCDTRIHFRPFIKQNKLKVDHLHVHLQPRFSEDKLYTKCQINHKNIFKPLCKRERNKMTRLLKF